MDIMVAKQNCFKYVHMWRKRHAERFAQMSATGIGWQIVNPIPAASSAIEAYYLALQEPV